MFKILTSGCEPTRGSEFSACVDVYASEDIVIPVGETAIVGLGIQIDLEDFFKTRVHDLIDSRDIKEDEEIKDTFMRLYYLALHPRSSLRAKGIISNTGIIDMDYNKEIKIILHNFSANSDYVVGSQGDIFKKDEISNPNSIDYTHCYVIKKGDRIAQITLMKHHSFWFGITSEDKRDGGFGSTN